MTERPNQTEPTDGEQPPEDRVPVHIPARLDTAIQQRLQSTNFDSTDEYVSFVLESLLRELARQTEDPDIDPGDREDSEEPAQLQDRLESLGYL